MKRLGLVFIIAIFALAQFGCKSTGTAKSIKALPQIKKVAVVSLAVSDWGGSVKYGSVGSKLNNTLQKATNSLIDYSEKTLSGQFKVVKASSFVGKKSYRNQTEELVLSAYVPQVKGKPLGVFTQQSRPLKRGDLAPEKAAALCKALGVDGVFLIFSEWTVKTGAMVPITKAVTKNIVSLWDANGQKVFTRRVDKMGTKVLGGVGFKVLNEATVSEWTRTYKESLVSILK